MKRDFCGNSNEEEDAKKLKEGCLNISKPNDIPDEAFTQSLNHLIVEANEGRTD